MLSILGSHGSHNRGFWKERKGEKQMTGCAICGLKGLTRCLVLSEWTVQADSSSHQNPAESEAAGPASGPSRSPLRAQDFTSMLRVRRQTVLSLQSSNNNNLKMKKEQKASRGID